MKKQNTSGTSCCSTRQKIWGVIALAGLFACGLMVGVTLNTGTTGGANTIRDKQCGGLAKQIVKISSYSNISADDLNLLKELNQTYEQNCAGYVADVKDKEHVSANKIAAGVVLPDQETCRVIETMLIRQLYPEDVQEPMPHEDNIRTYEKLTKYGCAENKETYQAMIQREQEILAALTGKTTDNNTQTCTEIESLLLQQLPDYNMNDCNIRIERAKIYANLSERGCPENSQQYVNLAAKELEIARALRDDNFSRAETDDVVETYRRLQMKQAASEVLDKVQKLTDPAIDFIMQVQKVIEE